MTKSTRTDVISRDGTEQPAVDLMFHVPPWSMRKRPFAEDSLFSATATLVGTEKGFCLLFCSCKMFGLALIAELATGEMKFQMEFFVDLFCFEEFEAHLC